MKFWKKLAQKVLFALAFGSTQRSQRDRQQRTLKPLGSGNHKTDISIENLPSIILRSLVYT